MDINQYPSLKKEEEKMMKFVEYYVKEIMDNEFNGSAILHMDEVCEAYEIEYGEVLDQPLFQKMLSDREEFTEVERDLGKLFIEINDSLKDPEPREVDRRDLDIMLANHVLWYYGERDKNAGFSNCIIKGFDLSGVNLRECTCENTVFEDCDMRDVNFEYARPISAKFINCDMRNINAKLACFNNAEFRNCDLSDAALTGSLLKGASMVDCETQNIDMRECDLTGFEQTDSNEPEVEPRRMKM